MNKSRSGNVFILIIDAGATISLAVDASDVFLELLQARGESADIRVDPVEFDLMVDGKLMHLSFLSWAILRPSSEDFLPRLANLIRKLQCVFDGFVVLRSPSSLASEQAVSSCMPENCVESVVFTAPQLGHDFHGAKGVPEIWAAIRNVARKRLMR